MIIYRRSLYSGYSEAQPSGASYIESQVLPVMDTIESVSAPKSKRVIRGIKGSLKLAGVIPTKEDYIKAEAASGAKKGIKLGKKVSDVLDSDQKNPNFPSKLITLIGSGIGAGIGSIKGYFKYKKKKKDGYENT